MTVTGPAGARRLRPGRPATRRVRPGPSPDTHSVSGSRRRAAYGRSPRRAPPGCAASAREEDAAGRVRAAQPAPWSDQRSSLVDQVVAGRVAAADAGLRREDGRAAVVDPGEVALALPQPVGQHQPARRAAAAAGPCGRRRPAAAGRSPRTPRSGEVGQVLRARPRRRRGSRLTGRVAASGDLVDLDGGVGACHPSLTSDPRRTSDSRWPPPPTSGPKRRDALRARATGRGPGAPAPGQGVVGAARRSLRTTR